MNIDSPHDQARPTGGERGLGSNARPTGKVRGAIRRLARRAINLIQPAVHQTTYVRWLMRWLSAQGLRFEGVPIYIAPTVQFDGTDLSLITIGDKVVISSHVVFLTHDFSLARTRDALAGRTIKPEVAIIRPIKVGDNCFVGFRSILLPGTELGANCIVGAGSVVRGRIPANSIVAGNPATIVGNSLEWGAAKLKKHGLL